MRHFLVLVSIVKFVEESITYPDNTECHVIRDGGRIFAV